MTTSGSLRPIDPVGEQDDWDGPRPMSAADHFHAHLDECAQCERHPFALCAVGAELLVATARKDTTR